MMGFVKSLFRKLRLEKKTCRNL